MKPSAARPATAAVAGAPDFHWIVPDLALGGAPQAGGLRAIADAGIGAVIDVRLEAADPEAELAARGILFLHLPTRDLCAVSPPMLDAGVDFARAAARQGRRLLIHCQHGIGRAPLVMLCVLADRGRDPRAAVSLLKDAREKVSPSPCQYEAWREWLRRRHPRANVPTFEDFAAIAYRHLR